MTLKAIETKILRYNNNVKLRYIKGAVSIADSFIIMFPNAPNSLKISWDNAISFEASFLSQNYQGGVDEKGNRNQLNQVVGTQTLTLTIDSLFTYSEIDTFLTNNLGKPFYFNSTLYRCETFKWTPSSDKVFKLELSLIQIFRP